MCLQYQVNIRSISGHLLCLFGPDSYTDLFSYLSSLCFRNITSNLSNGNMEQISIMLILIHGFYSKLKTILPFNIYLLIIYLAALGVSCSTWDLHCCKPASL